MKHLTDEQLEEIMVGGAMETQHLANCASCRQRLAEKQALAERLRQAFADVKAPAALAEGIRQQNAAAGQKGALGSSPRPNRLHAHWRGWAAAVSALAALLIIAPLFMNVLFTPTPAVAALVEIHQHNISQHGAFVAETDPVKLAAYFKEHLGFDPRLPEPDHGLALRGCCVRHFQGRIAGSYVVATPKCVMSVVVVRQTPESLGITERIERDNRTYWKSSFAKCNMVSVRIGDYTYCAVGETPHAYLTDLLCHLVDDPRA